MANVSILLKKIVLIGLLSTSVLLGCTYEKNVIETPLQPNQSAIEKWQAMRFGMFIHFGAYADLAGVWQGKQIEKLGEQIQRHADISSEDYQKVVKQFNPKNFDAEKIVKLAKKAGMRYIVLTTKHHDGFSMFESKHTDFDIVDFTPYKKDLLKQLADATKRYGLKLGLYYSTPDWHFNGPNPERNPVDGKISVFGKVSKANEDFQVAQLEELMTNYGDIVEVFFDMGEPTLAQSKRFRDVVKKYQPNALINGRVMNNQGDFLTMPDNHVPDSPITDYPWETPGTFYHTWGYKSWVKGLPLEQQISVQVRKLSDIASMGGNFLLNIGPKGDGSVLPYEKDVLLGVGNWVDKNKEAIFETGLNPFLKLDWGQVSTKQGTLYLHIHQWPKDNKIVLPGFKSTVSKASPLTQLDKNLSVVYANGNAIVDLSGVAKDPYLSIIKLSYEGELNLIPRHSKANQDGKITLVGDEATKHGKFGKQSYRSMLKDFSRSWYVDVPKAGSYKVKINYKMRYKDKDFILANSSDELAFNLKGKGKKVKKLQAFDGNEQVAKTSDNLDEPSKNSFSQNNTSQSNFFKSNLGQLHFSQAGIQQVTLKQGQAFELKASTQDFKAQDQRYRAMNIEIDSIELMLPNT
ncbi:MULTISPECIES: alpha-L-fucosidase [unclassified Pseudoalteromonas]|uniref:alpha-L-fucosidase n=1 Tax=unclassified Pseudoalteromonas TaxID=194690 RepID=UPI0006939E33|nr:MULTISPECIES: alpha-L-fucosidase [unclassified Pseudoalteromonas]